MAIRFFPSTQQLEISKGRQISPLMRQALSVAPLCSYSNFGSVTEQAWPALGVLPQSGAHRCPHNGPATSLHQLEIQPPLDGICCFHSSTTLLIYIYPLTSYCTHPPQPNNSVSKSYGRRFSKEFGSSWE